MRGIVAVSLFIVGCATEEVVYFDSFGSNFDTVIRIFYSVTASTCTGSAFDTVLYLHAGMRPPRMLPAATTNLPAGPTTRRSPERP